MEEKINLQLDLPPEASHYSFRLGGHTHIQGKLKLGTLKHENGDILKPLIKDDIRSVRELSFYQEVFKNSESDSIFCELKSFLPSFHGTWETAINDTNINYLCIEDLCGKFQKPSVLDVKIGAITYEPNAPKEKIEKDTKKYPLCKVIGFRILGMKVYDHSKKEYVSQGRKFGLSLTEETVNAGIEKFFNNQLGQINCLILSGILHKLYSLRSWFFKQNRLVFISTSLLLVYETEVSTWNTFLRSCNIHFASCDICKQNGEPLKEYTVLHYKDCSPVFSHKFLSTQSNVQKICSICKLNDDICSDLQKENNLLRTSLIDFAHVLPTTEEDSNYISGLNNFISHLQILLNKYFIKN